MKKTLIALAVAAAVAPGFAAAEGATVSGFADITYKASSDAAGQNLFYATAEVDFRNTQGDVTVGLDVDLDTIATTGQAAEIEQAFFAWGAVENLTVLGGMFNNPIGREAQDAPDMDSTTASIVSATLDTATAVYGNNVAGLAAAYDAGVATVTVGMLDDLGLAKDTAGDYETSYALVVNASPMEGLDLELGYASQEGATSAGDVVDFNATYAAGPAKAAFEYFTADKVVDSIIGVLGGYNVTEEAGLLARYEVLSYEDSTKEDYTQTTLAVSYKIADNLTLVAEHNSQEAMSGTKGNDQKDATLEFIATF